MSYLNLENTVTNEPILKRENATENEKTATEDPNRVPEDSSHTLYNQKELLTPVDTVSVLATCCTCLNLFGAACFASLFCLLDGNCAESHTLDSPSNNHSQQTTNKRGGGFYYLDSRDTEMECEVNDDWSFTNNPFSNNSNDANNCSPFENGYGESCCDGGGSCDGGGGDCGGGGGE